MATSLTISSMLGVSSPLVHPRPRLPAHDRARHTLCRCSAADKGGDSKLPDAGSSDIQDALADVMRLNIQKLEAMEQLDSVTNDEKLKLIKKVDEASEEIDAMRKLNADRRKLAFGSAQADIDEKYRLMSAELQKAREEMEADQADFEAFRDKVEQDQQAGLWFKRLYEQKRPKNSKKGSARATAAAVNKVREATVRSLRRRSRKAAFAFVITVAGATIASEILTGRGDAPVVKWHIAFLGATALLAAITSFAENDISNIDFAKGRSGTSSEEGKKST